MFLRMIRLEAPTPECPTRVLLSLVDASSPFGVMSHPPFPKKSKGWDRGPSAQAAGAVLFRRFAHTPPYFLLLFYSHA